MRSRTFLALLLVVLLALPGAALGEARHTLTLKDAVLQTARGERAEIKTRMELYWDESGRVGVNVYQGDQKALGARATFDEGGGLTGALEGMSSRYVLSAAQLGAPVDFGVLAELIRAYGRVAAKSFTMDFARRNWDVTRRVVPVTALASEDVEVCGETMNLRRFDYVTTEETARASEEAWAELDADYAAYKDALKKLTGMSGVPQNTGMRAETTVWTDQETAEGSLRSVMRMDIKSVTQMPAGADGDPVDTEIILSEQMRQEGERFLAAFSAQTTLGDTPVHMTANIDIDASGLLESGMYLLVGDDIQPAFELLATYAHTPTQTGISGYLTCTVLNDASGVLGEGHFGVNVDCETTQAPEETPLPVVSLEEADADTLKNAQAEAMGVLLQAVGALMQDPFFGPLIAQALPLNP